jgi:predicted PurR-regulated permease PerM
MKKIPYISYLPIGILLIIFFKLIENYKHFFELSNNLFSTLSPIIIGFIFAFFLNPLVDLTAKKFKLKRSFGVVLVYISISLLLVLFFISIVPNIVHSLGDLVSDIPLFVEKTKAIFMDYYDKIDEINLEMYINDDLVTKLSSGFSNVINYIAEGIVGFIVALFSSIFKIIIGFILSIYMVLDRDKINLMIKKLIIRINGLKSEKILTVINETILLLRKYFVGQATDSLVVAILSFIGFSIIGAPYAIVLAIILGFSNMIPSVGPFIGAIPAIVLTLFFDPIKSLWILLFIIVIQQVDSFIISPKIVGDSVGLGALAIIVSIIIGGGLFGIIGMIVAVPTMAMISKYIQIYTNEV